MRAIVFQGPGDKAGDEIVPSAPSREGRWCVLLSTG